MALKYHPDKAGDSSKVKFQHVGLAYEILMAKTNQNGKSSATNRYAGMSAEDVAYIKNIWIQCNMAHSHSRPGAIHHRPTIRRQVC